MNTETIAYGWEINAGTDILALIGTLRGELETVHRSLVVAQLAVHAALAIDEADAAGVPRRDAAIFDAMERYTRFEENLASGLVQGVSPSMSLTFDTDPETGLLYMWAQVHFSQYVRTIDNLEVGVFLPHWDELGPAERPYGVSEKEWERRGRIWERVLRAAPPQDTAGRIMLAIGSHLPDHSLLTEASAVYDALPDDEQRAHHRLTLMPGMPVPPDYTEYRAQIQEAVIGARALLKPITFNDIAGAAS